MAKKKLDLISLWLKVMPERLPRNNEEIENIDWESGPIFNNWRNYIPSWAKENWKDIPNDMRIGIIFMAQEMADKEEIVYGSND